jgi:hypothetical protein
MKGNGFDSCNLFVIGLVLLILSIGVILMVEGKGKYSEPELRGMKEYPEPQFEVLGLNIRVYTIKGHEYITIDDQGITHKFNCTYCEQESRVMKGLRGDREGK